MTFAEFMRGETPEIRDPDVRVGRRSFEEFCQELWGQAFEEGVKSEKEDNDT